MFERTLDRLSHVVRASPQSLRVAQVTNKSELSQLCAWQVEDVYFSAEIDDIPQLYAKERYRMSTTFLHSSLFVVGLGVASSIGHAIGQASDV
ncbi:MAG TPA: hypothetical protein VIM98_09715 [Dyella sp.]|uniref:hypothetical protein n=1 Tax=Dyella sp. TaxID=1869338 RepID=UPI002F941E25